VVRALYSLLARCNCHSRSVSTFHIPTSLRTQGSQKVFKSHKLPLPSYSNALAGLAGLTGSSSSSGSGSGVTSSNSLRALLQTGSLFAYLPDPTVCFPGARYKQQLDFRLQEGASLLVVDWFTAGRTVSGGGGF
jgi:hypothetical protein